MQKLFLVTRCFHTLKTLKGLKDAQTSSKGKQIPPIILEVIFYIWFGLKSPKYLRNNVSLCLCFLQSQLKPDILCEPLPVCAPIAWGQLSCTVTGSPWHTSSITIITQFCIHLLTSMLSSQSMRFLGLGDTFIHLWITRI
jgi:hypothetical protein